MTWPRLRPGPVQGCSAWGSATDSLFGAIALATAGGTVAGTIAALWLMPAILVGTWKWRRGRRRKGGKGPKGPKAPGFIRRAISRVRRKPLEVPA